LFNAKDISTEFIYRCLDSDKSTSELLEFITAQLSKKAKNTLWNVGVINENSGRLNFIKEDKFFFKLNTEAKNLLKDKDSPQILKQKYSGYKYSIAAPIKYKKQDVGIVICLTSKKNTNLVKKITRALAHFIKQHRLKKKLLEDAMLMNIIINANQGTSTDKNTSSLIKILSVQLKKFLKASGLRVYMKTKDGSSYFYDRKGNRQIFEGTLSGSITGMVLQSKRPRMVHDVSAEESYNKNIDDVSGSSDIKRIIAVPLVVSGEAVGVLVVSGGTDREVFVGSDLVWAKNIAGQIAAAYERLKLYKDIHKLFISAVEAFAAAIDGKDPYTHGHSRRVTLYSMLLGKALELDKQQLEYLRLSALLHDIGKIAVPGYILTKEEKLTDQECGRLKEHPQRGVNILKHIKEFGPLLGGIKHHHERWDGDGYPDGLKKDKIPYLARIITVADAFDAMVSQRVYRKALSEDEALKELEECSGTHFDGELASKFIDEYKKKFYSGKSSGKFSAKSSGKES
jgi:HD-GYP domain-containing protein (c-di-GMP phosphodiesterase class II)